MGGRWQWRRCSRGECGGLVGARLTRWLLLAVGWVVWALWSAPLCRALVLEQGLPVWVVLLAGSVVDVVWLGALVVVVTPPGEAGKV